MSQVKLWCRNFFVLVFQYKNTMTAASWSSTPDLPVFSGATYLRGSRDDGGLGRLLRMDGWFYPRRQAAEASRRISPFRGYLLHSVGLFPAYQAGKFKKVFFTDLYKSVSGPTESETLNTMFQYGTYSKEFTRRYQIFTFRNLASYIGDGRKITL